MDAEAGGSLIRQPTPESRTDGTADQPQDRVIKGKRSAQMPLFLAGLAVALLISITVAVTIGPVPIHPMTVWKIVAGHILNADLGDWPQSSDHIVWLIRLPRVLLAALIGATLATIGATMQAAVRNPIADPYILGVSSGASVGAVLVILFGLNVFGFYSLAIAAFLGALVAFALVFALAQHRGRLSPARLILVGVAASYVFSALTSFLLFRAHETSNIQAVLFWLAGSVAGAKWSYLTLPAAVLAAGTAYLVLQARSMNALAAGEETAVTLGVDTTRVRKQLMTVTALLTGVMVAVSGAIGFVGLIMPHTVRLLVGSDHRRMLPVGVLAGAIFLVWVDVLARTVVQPEELPIGVITALVGGPFFIWLLRRQERALGRGGK